MFGRAGAERGEEAPRRVSINGALSAGWELASLALASDAPDVVPGAGSDLKDPPSRELAYFEIPVLALRQLSMLLDSAR